VRGVRRARRAAGFVPKALTNLFTSALDPSSVILLAGSRRLALGVIRKTSSPLASRSRSRRRLRPLRGSPLPCSMPQKAGSSIAGPLPSITHDYRGFRQRDRLSAQASTHAWRWEELRDSSSGIYWSRGSDGQARLMQGRAKKDGDSDMAHAPKLHHVDPVCATRSRVSRSLPLLRHQSGRLAVGQLCLEG
jgi:hypothetical protein